MLGFKMSGSIIINISRKLQSSNQCKITIQRYSNIDEIGKLIKCGLIDIRDAADIINNIHFHKIGYILFFLSHEISFIFSTAYFNKKQKTLFFNNITLDKAFPFDIY